MDSLANGTSTSVAPAMSDRRGEPEPFLGSSSPERRSINCSKPPLCQQFFTVGAALPESGLRPTDHGNPPSEWMSIAGSKVGRDLDDLYVVMHLDEFALVGRRPAIWRKRRRLERLTRMHEKLT